MGYPTPQPANTKNVKDPKFESTNINNFKIMIRMKQDVGTIGYNLIMAFPLKGLNLRLGYLKADSQHMIGKYVVGVYEAVRIYNATYWSYRYKQRGLKAQATKLLMQQQAD